MNTLKIEITFPEREEQDEENGLPDSYSGIHEEIRDLVQRKQDCGGGTFGDA